MNSETDSNNKDKEIKYLKLIVKRNTRRMIILTLLFGSFLLYDSMLSMKKRQIHNLQKKISEKKEEVIADLSEAVKNAFYVIDQPSDSSAGMYFSKAYNAYRKAHYRKYLVEKLEDSLNQIQTHKKQHYKNYKVNPGIIIRR